MPSPQYEATGKIVAITPTQSFASGFTKRQIVIETDGDSKYPQQVPFEVVKDKCSELDRYHIGQIVTVRFDVRGNEHNGKYYVSLQAWRIESDSQGRSENQNGAPPPRNMNVPSNRDSAPADDSEDDIPF